MSSGAHEGNQHDGIVVQPRGGCVLFDSQDQFYYMARKGNAFFLVEERLG
jgi:hypothetical protein